jgi:hypothetical protein
VEDLYVHAGINKSVSFVRFRFNFFASMQHFNGQDFTMLWSGELWD